MFSFKLFSIILCCSFFSLKASEDYIDQEKPLHIIPYSQNIALNKYITEDKTFIPNAQILFSSNDFVKLEKLLSVNIKTSYKNYKSYCRKNKLLALNKKEFAKDYFFAPATYAFSRLLCHVIYLQETIKKIKKAVPSSMQQSFAATTPPSLTVLAIRALQKTSSIHQLNAITTVIGSWHCSLPTITYTYAVELGKKCAQWFCTQTIKHKNYNSIISILQVSKLNLPKQFSLCTEIIFSEYLSHIPKLIAQVLIFYEFFACTAAARFNNKLHAQGATHYDYYQKTYYMLTKKYWLPHKKEINAKIYSLQNREKVLFLFNPQIDYLVTPYAINM